LQARYRGYFVPPRPEKNAVEGQRQSEGFIAERRAALDRYLVKLAAHPLVGPGEVRACGGGGGGRGAVRQQLLEPVRALIQPFVTQVNGCVCECSVTDSNQAQHTDRLTASHQALGLGQLSLLMAWWGPVAWTPSLGSGCWAQLQVCLCRL
jgi:hypothetical protein